MQQNKMKSYENDYTNSKGKPGACQYMLTKLEQILEDYEKEEVLESAFLSTWE